MKYQSETVNNKDFLSFSNLPAALRKGFASRLGLEDSPQLEVPIELRGVGYGESYSRYNFFSSISFVEKASTIKYWYTSDSDEVSNYVQCLDIASSFGLPIGVDTFYRSCSTKTAHWLGEEESRAILLGMHWAPSMRKLKASFSQIEGIIFGVNTPDEAKVKIIKKIAVHCAAHKRSDFKFYQAKFKSDYSEIEYYHLKYITFNPDGTLNLEKDLPS